MDLANRHDAHLTVWLPASEGVGTTVPFWLAAMQRLEPPYNRLGQNSSSNPQRPFINVEMWSMQRDSR